MSSWHTKTVVKWNSKSIIRCHTPDNKEEEEHAWNRQDVPHRWPTQRSSEGRARKAKPWNTAGINRWWKMYEKSSTTAGGGWQNRNTRNVEKDHWEEIQPIQVRQNGRKGCRKKKDACQLNSKGKLNATISSHTSPGVDWFDTLSQVRVVAGLS